MGMFRAALLLGLLAGCAPTDPTASEDTGGVGENFSNPYPESRVRLEQTSSSDISPSLSLACSDSSGTKENSWYRIFQLSDFGIDGVFTVNRVNFGVQTVIGEQRVKVSIGTYAGPYGSVELDLTKVDVLAMTTVHLRDGKAFDAQANFAGVQIPAGANLIVEVRSEGIAKGGFFYLGATSAIEMQPGYLRAPGCDTPNPRMTSALGALGTHLVISVSGTH
jgi:hypothetical protein